MSAGGGSVIGWNCSQRRRKTYGACNDVYLWSGDSAEQRVCSGHMHLGGLCPLLAATEYTPRDTVVSRLITLQAC